MTATKRMTAKEAREVLERYLDQAPQSIELLRTEMGLTSLDFSLADLVTVWQHFIAHLTTRAETDDELNSVPDWVKGSIPAVTFTDETKYRIVRTSFYFGEVCTREFPKVKWAVAKSGAYRDKPVLLGFRNGDELCPLSLVEVQARKAIRGASHPTALVDLLEIWRSYSA